MTMQQYCLRWNNHQPNFISVFSNLLNNESLVDVTLAAEGRHLQAHKVVLSACSSYFQSLFTVNPCQHPIVILKDVKFADLKVMVDFMYYGEVNVSQEQLPHILKTAEMLKIKGLAEIPVDQSVSKSQTGSVDRAELLTPGDSNWSTEMPRQSLSPSPLSPNSKRKRLRKSSTGSGSGSIERTSEEHQQTSEVTLTSSTSAVTTTSGGSIIGTVIKSDPGSFASDSSLIQIKKQHSSDSDLQRGSSHESIEGDIPHQVTLQVSQEMNVQHSLESASSVEVAGPSSNTPQITMSGMQWNVMDHAAYAHYASCSSPVAVTATASSSNNNPNYTQCPQNINNHHHHHHHVINQQSSPPQQPPTPQPQQPAQQQQQQQHNYHNITNSPPQIIQKRKRSINPQGDENFIRALEAVRFGGIGFCKAARMYGVNNRTLWLEYKKRGYPNFRLSIKSRKQEDNMNENKPVVIQTTSQTPLPPPPTPSQSSSASASPHQQQQIAKPDSEHVSTSVATSSASSTANQHPVALISSAFFEGKHVDLGSVLQQRPKYLDAAIINAQQAINFQGINFEQM